MAIEPSAVWDFAREVVGVVRPDRGRTLATVTRVDPDGTTWVTTGDGGEAPAASVGAGVSVGDTVTLEWDGSAMGIRSNVSDPAPPGSSIRRAVDRARGVASAAQQVADAVNQHFFADTSGIHVTEATQEDWNTNHSGANVLINSIGQLFRDGLNNLLTLTTENGARALTVWDGLGNTADHIRAIIGETIQLGNADSGNYMTLDDTGVEIYNESKTDGYSAKIGPAIVRLLGDSFNIETVIDGGTQRTYFDSIISHTVGKTSFIRLRTSQHRYIESDVASIITLHADALMLDGAVQRTEGTVTATTANATIISGVNHCWTNNATTTITVGVNLKSSLANQGLVQVATAPSGYRPPYTVVGSVYVTGQVVNLQAWIDANGAISVNNRSGTSVTTSANIYISFTFAP